MGQEKPGLREGIYERLIDRTLAQELSEIAGDRFEIRREAVPNVELPAILSKHVAKILERRLTEIGESSENAIERQLCETNRLLKDLGMDALSIPQSRPASAEQLLALFDKTNRILALDSKAPIVRPETSIANTSLFTGAVREPQMFSELKREILSCDRIDMLVSFVKWSGLRLLIDELRTFTQNGGTLRVITTSYMGATEVKAVVELSKLANTQVKISYDTTRTRLHAKAYIFHRATGFDTAYVGSSNISNAALSSGLEWNLKITKTDLPDTFRKVLASFDAYWNAPEFETYSAADFDRLRAALRAESSGKFSLRADCTFEIRPFAFQQEILDHLETERKVHGRFRNLVVAATGTGKTVISALDYRRFRAEHSKSPARLLFVAHREEILEQSLRTFRAVLRDQNFGDLLVGSHEAKNLDHLFLSIQTFHSKKFFEKTAPDFYDFIVIDEFHHASAATYQMLLSHYTPKILLGLTATPERRDGKDVLEYFDGKIAASIRLPEAIDRKLLCPFQYFGVTDSVNLSEIAWKRGGYDRDALSNVYTLDRLVAENRAKLIADSTEKYVADMDRVKGLGFCVSKAHAKFMAEQFNLYGIPSLYLTGESDDELRRSAKAKLLCGEIRFIFVVDLYNEGVDIPEVNTILFLRPTESLTIFLQQLGRGLRLSEGKDCLTVLDFIGQANQKYSFEEKFCALLSNTRRGVRHEIENGFVSLPKGCYIQLERKASEYILENIRASLNSKNSLVEKIRNFEKDFGEKLSLSNFLERTHLSPAQIYKRASFSRLCVLAKVRPDFRCENEAGFEKALVRFSAVDSRRFIEFMLRLLAENPADKRNLTQLSPMEKRMLAMFHFTFWGKTLEEKGFASFEESARQILKNAELCGELSELLRFNYERIDVVDRPIGLRFDCPLDVHCTYSRDQILVACDFLKPATVREGVKFLPKLGLDLLFVTLNKSEKDFSESTRYKDYSVNESLFHWQSQSTTSADSETALRYISGHGSGNSVLLFVREFKKDSDGNTLGYTCLGKAICVEHSGSKPLDIVWKLETPIPAKFLKQTGQLMVG